MTTTSMTPGEQPTLRFGVAYYFRNPPGCDGLTHA